MTTTTVLRLALVAVVSLILMKASSPKKKKDALSAVKQVQLQEEKHLRKKDLNQAVPLSSQQNKDKNKGYSQQQKLIKSSNTNYLPCVQQKKAVRPVLGKARNNHRSGQISLTELQQAIDSLKIKTVIRLNGDFEKDNGGVKIDDEKYLCEHQNDDVKFYEINFYSTDALNRIHNILMEGNTLIHCKHGYDRTGAAVGYHLRKDGYSLWDVVIHNKWEDYRNKKSEKYLTDYWEVIL